jgi:hypothetical protein
MRKRFDTLRNFAHDDMGVFDSFLSPFRVNTYTFNGQFIDMDKYDVTLKPNYIEQEIKRVDQELETLERERDSSNKYFDGRKAFLMEEKEKYKRQKSLSG